MADDLGPVPADGGQRSPIDAGDIGGTETSGTPHPLSTAQQSDVTIDSPAAPESEMAGESTHLRRDDAPARSADAAPRSDLPNGSPAPAAPSPPIETAEPLARRQTTGAHGAVGAVAAEDSTSAPETDAARHSAHIHPTGVADPRAADPRTGSAPLQQTDTGDEPLSRRRTDTTPAALPWLDTLRFSWIDAARGGALVTPPSAESADDPSVHRQDPGPHPPTDDASNRTPAQRTGSASMEQIGPRSSPEPIVRADITPGQSGSTDNVEADRKTGRTPHRATGRRTDSPDRTDAAELSRRTDAPRPPAPIEDTATAHRPGPVQRTITTDGSTAAREGTRPPQAREAVPPIAGAAAQRTDDAAAARRKKPAHVERSSTTPRPAVAERTETADGPEALRIVREMSARHGVEVVGFDAADVDVQVVREIASAIDELLAKYPLPLRGVELTDGAESRPRPDRTPTANQSAESAIWIVLDRAALNPPRAAPVETRRVFRRRGPAERPVYKAVVREFAGALDLAGGFRARQEALRTLINESLRGGGGGAGLLDPGRALVDGFTEVVLRGERAGASAKELHAALVKMARAESTDGLSA
ncbi:hypothetical protein [Nocardia exalbida]|uniref:hypothetical protein n=1 Tax=Nocardia exalbida TaxID=290231 RepID=UPI0005937D50|nr:hypothetical protein [Nocardia exalbida]